MSTLPFLDEDEIDRLCKPLKQRHAQARRLCQLLNVKDLPRRPDGLPLVGRKMAENVLNQTAAPGQEPASSGIRWSK